MTGLGVLLAASLAVPVAMLLVCVISRCRIWVSTVLWMAPVPALAAALGAPYGQTLAFPQALFGVTLTLDRPGAMLLGAAALLWIAAGSIASRSFFTKPNGSNIAPWWLLALTGNLGVFIAADLASFYLFLAMASLSAYGLIVHGRSASARRAGAIYVGFALLAEASVLMGLVLLAAGSPDGSLAIRDAVAALPASPWRNAAIAMLLVGFAMKIGLVPFHVWMPFAYTAAPIPAAAVLSGAAVNAGVIGLIRFLPLDVAQPAWGYALAAAGLISAFYGVLIGLTQQNPKTVLAYSSVSQLGLIAATLGMGLAAGDPGAGAAAGFYATHHLFAKGALFLAIGAAALQTSNKLWIIWLPAAIVALGLAGLPLSGGALAKAAIKGPLGDGLVSTLAGLSAAASTVLMLHFVGRLASIRSNAAGKLEADAWTAPWLAMAAAAVFAPWLLVSQAMPDTLQSALSLKGLWDAVWPVLLGVITAMAIHRWMPAMPSVPEGDIAIALRAGERLVENISATCERADTALRRWAVAGLSLLALALLLIVGFNT
jgi:multicomponent Na+:H+ antiporter subunit A